MNRRTAIQNLMLVAGGFVLVPACQPQPGKASIALLHFNLTYRQEQLLQAVATAIIPETDTPGAGALGCHLFVAKMLDDCYDKAAQEQFVRGLNRLEDVTHTRLGHSFTTCTMQQQQELLDDIEAGAVKDDDITLFYRLMKERVIEGYMTSKYVLNNINHYEFIPSQKYNGYVRVPV